MNFEGKRLLILAGANVHMKLVEAARLMGVFTIVTDNVPGSPAKQIADKSYDIDIFDMDGLEKLCSEENIDGIIADHIDPCQRPYNELCERLGLYCYGTKEQFFKMTDKHAFKEMCIENGVDVIPEYRENEIDNVIYPVFVKPVDSRGSRGQTVCYNLNQLKKAIVEAKKESSNGDIIIEKYMKGAHEFQVTYFFVDGEPYLIRTCDSYCGSEEKKMDKVVACAISPSRFTQSYLDKTHERIIKMIKSLGIKNGPVFMQGFEDNGVFRFFDPGLRFPGVDYERIYKKVFGIDLMENMVSLALSGRCSGNALPTDGVWLKGKRAAILFPTVNAGKVFKVCGINETKSLNGVVSVLPRCNEGDTIRWSYNVNQRSAEIDCIADDTESLKSLLKKIQNQYKVIDCNGNDMTFESFNSDRIL